MPTSAVRFDQVSPGFPFQTCYKLVTNLRRYLNNCWEHLVNIVLLHDDWTLRGRSPGSGTVADVVDRGSASSATF